MIAFYRHDQFDHVLHVLKNEDMDIVLRGDNGKLTGIPQYIDEDFDRVWPLPENPKALVVMAI